MLGSEWTKSSYSFSNGNCIEAAWRTAARSMANGNCAEVAAWRKAAASGYANNCAEVGSGERVVAVRDTKEAHLGEQRTVLEFSPAAWRQFLDGLRATL